MNLDTPKEQWEKKNNSCRMDFTEMFSDPEAFPTFLFLQLWSDLNSSAVTSQVTPLGAEITKRLRTRPKWGHMLSHFTVHETQMIRDYIRAPSHSGTGEVVGAEFNIWQWETATASAAVINDEESMQQLKFRNVLLSVKLKQLYCRLFSDRLIKYLLYQPQFPWGRGDTCSNAFHCVKLSFPSGRPCLRHLDWKLLVCILSAVQPGPLQLPLGQQSSPDARFVNYFSSLSLF